MPVDPLSVPVHLLALPLQYDNRADDLTKEGMLKGIEQAAAFILFLSSGVLERPYCQLEIRHAMALKKPIVLLHGERLLTVGACERCCVRARCLFDGCPPTRSSLRSFLPLLVPSVPSGGAESDARYGSFDFRTAHATAPNDLRLLLVHIKSFERFTGPVVK